MREYPRKRVLGVPNPLGGKSPVLDVRQHNPYAHFCEPAGLQGRNLRLNEVFLNIFIFLALIILVIIELILICAWRALLAGCVPAHFCGCVDIKPAVGRVA